MKDTIKKLHELSASIEKMCDALGTSTDTEKSNEIKKKINQASEILNEANIDFTKLVHDYAELRFKKFSEKMSETENIGHTS